MGKDVGINDLLELGSTFPYADLMIVPDQGNLPADSLLHLAHKLPRVGGGKYILFFVGIILSEGCCCREPQNAQGAKVAMHLERKLRAHYSVCLDPVITEKNDKRK